MKIKEINILQQHHCFARDIKVDFTNEDNVIPKITYLIGNNGSGKTSILNIIAKVASEKKSVFACAEDFHEVINGLNGEIKIHIDDIDKKDEIYLNFKPANLHYYTVDGEDISMDAKMWTYAKNILSVYPFNRNVQHELAPFPYTKLKLIALYAKEQVFFIDTGTIVDSDKDRSNTIQELLNELKQQDEKDKFSFLSNNKTVSFENMPAHIGNRLSQLSGAFEFINKDSNLALDFSKLSKGEVVALLKIIPLIQKAYNQEKDMPLLFLIDEPEIGLHPEWQKKFVPLLKKIFESYTNIQFIIATHSPYIFMEMDDANEQCIKIDTKACMKSDKLSLYYCKKSKIFTSLSLYTYKAFNIATTSLHNELYGLIHRNVVGSSSIKCWDNKIIELDKSILKYKKYNNPNPNPKDKDKDKDKDVTLMSYIRHQIHHPENKLNPCFTYEELKQSIDIMIGILEKTNLDQFECIECDECDDK